MTFLNIKFFICPFKTKILYFIFLKIKILNYSFPIPILSFFSDQNHLIFLFFCTFRNPESRIPYLYLPYFRLNLSFFKISSFLKDISFFNRNFVLFSKILLLFQSKILGSPFLNKNIMFLTLIQNFMPQKSCVNILTMGRNYLPKIRINHCKLVWVNNLPRGAISAHIIQIFRKNPDFRQKKPDFLRTSLPPALKGEQCSHFLYFSKKHFGFQWPKKWL